MCCSFWKKCINSHKTGLGCSTPLRKNGTPNQKLAYFVLYLNIINTFMKIGLYIL